MNERQNRSGAPRRKGGTAPKQSNDIAGWRRNFERYTALAQNVGQYDDAVTRENYYQYAEHYLHMLNDAAAR